MSQVEKGVDNPRPVTEGRNKRSALRRRAAGQRHAAESGAVRFAYCTLRAEPYVLKNNGTDLPISRY